MSGMAENAAAIMRGNRMMEVLAPQMPSPLGE